MSVMILYTYGQFPIGSFQR